MTLNRSAEFRSVAVKQIVDAEAEVEQVPRRDARRVVHIVLRALGGNPQPRRAESTPCSRSS